MPNLIRDLINKSIGNLLIVEKTDKRKRNSVIWKAKCICGEYTEITNEQFSKKKKKSCGCLQKNKSDNSAFKALYDRYKYQSITRGYIFELSEEEFKTLTKANCAYCGIEPFQISKNKTEKVLYYYNGIDRKDNNDGYTTTNSVSCCGTCNDIKGQNLTYNEMLEAMKAILKYRENIRG